MIAAYRRVVYKVCVVQVAVGNTLEFVCLWWRPPCHNFFFETQGQSSPGSNFQRGVAFGQKFSIYKFRLGILVKFWWISWFTPGGSYFLPCAFFIALVTNSQFTKCSWIYEIHPTALSPIIALFNTCQWIGVFGSDLLRFFKAFHRYFLWLNLEFLEKKIGLLRSLSFSGLGQILENELVCCLFGKKIEIWMWTKKPK